jgi:hypothetical protein
MSDLYIVICLCIVCRYTFSGGKNAAAWPQHPIHLTSLPTQTFAYKNFPWKLNEMEFYYVKIIIEVIMKFCFKKT